MVFQKDLMVGDLVRTKDGKVMRVDAVSETFLILDDRSYDNSEVDPILIELEMLERNGFTWDGIYARLKEGRSEIEYYKHDGILREWYTHKDGRRELMAMSRPGFRYVHQLQNWLNINGICIKIAL